jgi:hypothetical protein
MAYTTYDTPAEFFNIAPTATGYSIASAAITLGCSDHATAGNRFITNLTAAQAALTTGSTAQVIYGLVDSLYKRFKSIATADLPVSFRLRRAGRTDEATDEIIYTYTITMRVSTATATANVATNT